MSKRTSINFIPAVFIALFPILPSYFAVGGVSAITLVCLMMIVYGLVAVKLKVKVNNLIIVLAVWVLWKAIVAMIHGEIAAWFVELGVYALACYLLFNCVYTEKQIRCYIDLLIRISTIVSCFGIIESVTGFNVFTLLNNTGYQIDRLSRFGFYRAMSSQSHAISFSLWAMMILGLIVYNQQFVKNKVQRTLYTISYIIVFASAILTFSRSSIMYIILSQVILLALEGYKRALMTALRIVILLAIVILIIYLVSPKIFSLLSKIWLMVAAVFDSDARSQIAGSFQNDNLSAFGERFVLYEWVISAVKGRFLFGLGPSAKFSHTFYQHNAFYTWAATKESIEVHHLSLLYHYGIIAVILEVYANICLIVSGIKAKRGADEANIKLSFGQTFFAISIGYLVSWFSSAHMSEYKLYLVIISLFLAYLSIIRSEMKK